MYNFSFYRFENQCGFFHGILCVEDGSAEGDARYAGLHDVGDVGDGDAADCYNRESFFHPIDDVAIALQTEDGRESLLGGGIAEWSASDVVGTSFGV